MNRKIGVPALIVLKRALRPFNLDVAPIGAMPDWLAHRQVEDPLTYLYFNEMRHTPLVEVQIAQARLGIAGFEFSPCAGNPFVMAFAAARQAADEHAATRAVRAVMSDYYRIVDPRTALQALSLDGKDAPGLVDVIARNHLLPWGGQSLTERAWRLRLWSLAGSVSNRQKMVLPAEGMSEFGPVSERKLCLEVERIVKLHRSIEESGFHNYGNRPMEVVGLRHDGEYRWLAIRGRHRFAACAVWGIDRVRARVRAIVRREDARLWPRVASGTFTERGALRLFDRLFDGEPMACALPWTKMHRSQLH